MMMEEKERGEEEENSKRGGGGKHSTKSSCVNTFCFSQRLDQTVETHANARTVRSFSDRAFSFLLPFYFARHTQTNAGKFFRLFVRTPSINIKRHLVFLKK